MVLYVIQSILNKFTSISEYYLPLLDLVNIFDICSSALFFSDVQTSLPHLIFLVFYSKNINLAFVWIVFENILSVLRVAVLSGWLHCSQIQGHSYRDRGFSSSEARLLGLHLVALK